MQKQLAMIRTWIRHTTGAATVEFALVVPIFFLLTFAAIEFGRMNMIRNSLENAAYEGAREGIVPGATAQRCRDAAQSIIDAIGIRGAVVDVQPAVILPETPEVTVTISVALNENGFVAAKFSKDMTLTKSCRLSRELGDNT